MLLTWLCAYYHGISGSQSVIHGDLLEAELTASGLVAPFVQVPDAGAAALARSRHVIWISLVLLLQMCSLSRIGG